MSIDDFRREPLLFGPSPVHPIAADLRGARWAGRNLGEAGGLQFGYRVRRQQGPQTRIPRS